MSFPHDSVERAIENCTVEPDMAVALRDLARASNGGAGLYKQITITAADSPYAVVPVSPRQHLVIMVDQTGGNVIARLPASPKRGDVVTVTDLAGTFATGNTITIDGNGNGIDGFPTIVYNVPTPPAPQYSSLTLMFTKQSGMPILDNGWRIIWDFGGVPTIIP